MEKHKSSDYKLSAVEYYHNDKLVSFRYRSVRFTHTTIIRYNL